MSHAIRAGCVLKIEKVYFKGSRRKPKFAGSAVYWVTVLRHSYGRDRGQHTFTCRIDKVVQPFSGSGHDVGSKFLIKGRNLYPAVIKHVQGDESKSVGRIC